MADPTHGSSRVGILGPIFAVLLAGSVLMTSGMPDAKNAVKDQTWIIKNKGLLGGSALLTILAVVVGLSFLMWLRSQLDKRGDWMGDVFLVGAAIFGISGTVAAGISITLSTDAKHLSTDSLQLMSSLNQNLNYPMTCIGLALMYLAAGFLIRRSQVLPGWLAWVSFVFAVLAISFFLGFIALLGTVLWTIVVGIMLAVRPQPSRS